MEETVKDAGDIQIYELGYHLLPTIPEADLAKEVADLHSIILDMGGVIIGDSFPALRNLAYEIPKRIETKTLNFNKAYFGWVKFEIDRSEIAKIQKKAEAIPNVLRFLIVKTVRENTMHTPKAMIFKKEPESEVKD